MIIVKSIELLCGGNNFANPSGLAVDKKNGLMYICDMNNRRIACFDFNSESIVTLGDLNRVNAEKRPKPLAVAFDNNRNLLMTDCENNLLWRFKNNEWKEIKINGGTEQFSFSLPGSIACDFTDNIYVADFLRNEIYTIDLYGRLKRHDNIKCKNPYGICLSEDGSKLYITDTGNSRIGVYNTLNWDYSWLAVENKSAIALCVDGYGNLYFSETRKLYRFSLKTQRCELVINSEIWKSLYGTRLCHLGAVASISEDKLAISDTVKNNVYILNIESVED